MLLFSLRDHQNHSNVTTVPISPEGFFLSAYLFTGILLSWRTCFVSTTVFWRFHRVCYFCYLKKKLVFFTVCCTGDEVRFLLVI